MLSIRLLAVAALTELGLVTVNSIFFAVSSLFRSAK